MLNRKAMISLGLCAATFAASNPTFAQVRSVAVAVSDLDLSSQSGQVQLEQRIERAARTVCASDSRSARNHNASKQCEAQAVANAKPIVANRIAQNRTQRGIAIRTDLKMASE